MGKPTGSYLGTRISVEIEQRFSTLAVAEGASKSALLRRAIILLLQSVAPAQPVRVDPPADVRGNHAFAVRLRPDDRQLLKERAFARGQPAATYIAALVRVHLRNLAPLPNRELRGLMQAVSELRAIARNLNVIARAINPDTSPNGPSRDDLMATVKVCGVLREHVRDLIATNLRSWEIGHAETSRRQ